MMLALKYWRELVIVAAVLALVGVWQSYRASLIERGRMAELVRVADSTLAVVNPQIVHFDTLIQRDTVTVRRTIARVDSVRDSVLVHLTDTLVVKEYVARTDTALKACSELSIDCAAFRAFAFQKFRADSVKLAAQPIATPRSCVVPAIVAGGLGVLGGYVAGRR